jgi:CheY-like chemotaxis protein
VRAISLLALSIGLFVCGFAGNAIGRQPPVKEEAQKPLALFAKFREMMNDGKFDLAAAFLKLFLDSNPTDAELLEIEKKYNTTVFVSLRNIPRWSDDAALDKKTREYVEELIKRSKAASEKLLRDPARVAKYIRNLGATYEEKIFAELELRRTGDYAVPYMVDELRQTRDQAIYAGLIETIPVLEGTTMSAWVAALDGLTPEQQYGVASAIASREDVLNLQTYAQSDLSGYLWRILAQPPEQSPALRALAEKLLRQLHPGIKADAKLPEEQLTALARTFYDHTARYSGTRNNGDGSPKTVAIWVWDAKTSKLIKNDEVPVGQAEEYYGLRYARWVLEAKPSCEPAQGLLISLAAERAIERARFGNLAKAEPGVFRLLSDAPSSVLADQLNRGLNQKNTSLSLAMIQVLGDRADRVAATPPAGPGDKPSLLVKALSYPDPQVQLAAANALLRSPVPVPSSARPLIVDILRRAVASEPGTSDDTMGTALLADPNKSRADAIALLLRGLGYRVEIMSTGRDLLRRIARSSDFDLILVDHHTPNPELIDLIGQLQADVKTANRPTLVVASSDKVRLPSFDQLVVRFAALIASTENETIGMEAPFKPDPRDVEKLKILEDARRQNAEFRDNVFRRAADTRIARLNRLIESTGIKLTDTQKLLLSLRVQLITYAILGVQFPYSSESAPITVDHVERLKRQLNAQPLSPQYGVGMPTVDFLKMLDRFEIDLARVPARKKEFDSLYSKLDPAEFGIAMETYREQVVEARLQRTLRGYPAVKIIPEPLVRSEFASEIMASYRDPAQAPRDPAEKKVAQKTAIDWLRKMAIGELPGYDLKAAEAEIRSALRVDDLAESAIEAVARFSSAAAQENLLSVALSGMRPLQIRTKAADATIQHIQVNGKSIPKTLLTPLAELSGTEADLNLRGKLLTLKGMLDFSPADYANQLKGYNPPLIPLPPAKAPPQKEPPPPPEKP